MNSVERSKDKDKLRSFHKESKRKNNLLNCVQCLCSVNKRSYQELFPCKLRN